MRVEVDTEEAVRIFPSLRMTCTEGTPDGECGFDLYPLAHYKQRSSLDRECYAGHRTLLPPTIILFDSSNSADASNSV